jgi:NDP-sugar pyrophosphorylase family protein
MVRVHAVVMAAGEGKRLRPLTERFAKPVLPVGGRPVVVTLVHELRAAGLDRITVVTGHHAAQVELLLDGLGVELVRQPRPDGSADVVLRAAAAGARPPFLVTAADTVYAAGDVARLAAAYATGRYDGALAVRRDPPPGPGRAAVAIEDGLVRRVVDRDPANPLAAAPLWILGERLARHLEGLPGPPYELAEALQRGIDAGLRVLGLEIGRTRDLTNPVDLVEHNFPYLEGLP